MYSLLVLISTLILCDSITIRYESDHRDIVTKFKFELAPIEITCQVQDMAIISAPVVNSKEVFYYLYKPNGEALRLDIAKPDSPKPEVDSTIPNTTNHFHYEKYEYGDYGEIIVKYINRDVSKTVYRKRNYRVINANALQSGTNTIVEDTENAMEENDFMMGPFSEDQNGNWILSVYCKDVDDSWIELFQVISIQLIEHVPMTPPLIGLEEGSSFRLSFAYTIKGLQSCELIAPRSSFDRYFDRSRIELDTCGYVVPNVTKEDEGIWTVVGVGKIAYEGIVMLNVGNTIRNK